MSVCRIISRKMHELEDKCVSSGHELGTREDRFAPAVWLNRVIVAQNNYTKSAGLELDTSPRYMLM